MTTCQDFFTFSWPLWGRGGRPKRSAWPLFSRFFFDAFPKSFLLLSVPILSFLLSTFLLKCCHHLLIWWPILLKWVQHFLIWWTILLFWNNQHRHLKICLKEQHKWVKRPKSLYIYLHLKGFHRFVHVLSRNLYERIFGYPLVSSHFQSEKGHTFIYWFPYRCGFKWFLKARVSFNQITTIDN